jgi:hypothetical protein
MDVLAECVVCLLWGTTCLKLDADPISELIRIGGLAASGEGTCPTLDAYPSMEDLVT